MYEIALTLEKTSIPSNSVFFVPDCKPYAAPLWRQTSDFRYYIYFIPVQIILKMQMRFCLWTKLLLPATAESEGHFISLCALLLILCWNNGLWKCQERWWWYWRLTTAVIAVVIRSLDALWSRMLSQRRQCYTGCDPYIASNLYQRAS